MRGKLNLGEEALGNVTHFSKVQSHIGEVKNLSVLELSELNRSKISATLLQEAEQYKQFLSWVKQEANVSHGVATYMPSLYFDMKSLASILSNVANAFNVGDIMFGRSIVEGVQFQDIPTVIPQSIISTIEPGLILFPLSIPHHYTDEVIKLGLKTNLFKNPNSGLDC